jgi:GGDEF domain-containing protein
MNSLNVIMAAGGGHPQATLRTRIAVCERENRDLKHKVKVLGDLVDGLCLTISFAILTIEAHEHNDKELMLLEADLAQLVAQAEQEILNL